MLLGAGVAKRSRPKEHVVAVRRAGEGCRPTGENCLASRKRPKAVGPLAGQYAPLGDWWL